MSNDPREERLPQWAQRELDRLRRNLASAQEEVRQLKERGVTPGRVAIDLYDDESAPIELGNQGVTFRLGERNPARPDRNLIRVTVADDGSGIEVYGTDDLVVAPRVTNVVFVSIGGLGRLR